MDERRRATSASAAGTRRRRASRARAFAVADVAAGSRPTRDHRERPRRKTRDRFSSVTRRDVALALALARRSRRSSPSTPSLGGDVSPVRVARGAPLRSPPRTCRPLRILGRSRAPALERRSRGATSSSTMSSRRMNARVHEMNARVHTDRSIDRSNRFDRYAWFNRHQPTTNQPTSRTNDRLIPPIRSVRVVQSTPTSRTNKRSIDRSVTHRSHHHSYGSKVEASHHGSIEPREHASIGSDRYEGFNRSIDRSIDTDRPTARDTRPRGRESIPRRPVVGGTRAHERVADDDLRGLEV